MSNNYTDWNQDSESHDSDELVCAGDILDRILSTIEPYFDRFDICEAYYQFEVDYHVSGVLQERKSNQRRKMSTGYQLHRMQYKRSPLHASYTDLSDNGKAIYNQLKSQYGL